MAVIPVGMLACRYPLVLEKIKTVSWEFSFGDWGGANEVFMKTRQRQTSAIPANVFVTDGIFILMCWDS